MSGNRTGQLFDRIYADGIAFQPDVISILIGINDVWGRSKHRILTTDAQIALNYRCILERIKNETNAKIVVLSPFVLDAPGGDVVREDSKKLVSIVKSLADEFADVYIPLDKLFDEAMKTQPEPMYYSADGVHPNENGRRFIGEIYAKAIEVLFDRK